MPSSRDLSRRRRCSSWRGSRSFGAFGCFVAAASVRIIGRARVPGSTGLSESLRANADDRLPVASLGRVERGDRIVEGRDVADVGPQSSVPHSLDDLC
jgi:hypothetical protein